MPPDRAPPVEDRGMDGRAISTPPASPGVQVQPYAVEEPVAQPLPYSPPPPAASAATPVASSSAVVALMKTAAGQQADGDTDQAAATLERALRIEPRNPQLWSQLAAVRLAQQRWDQAEELAQKSNRLAGQDRGLLIDNWRVIAEARRGAGDSAGAREAERRLNDL